MSNRALISASSVALISMFAPFAKASPLNFSYTSTNGISASWTQDSAPSSQYYVTGTYTDVPVTNGTVTDSGKTSSFSDLDFYPTFGETFQIFILSSASFITVYGPKVYTGTEAEPVFTAGSYTLTDGTLDISAPAPEPAGWALMLVGFGVLGARLRSTHSRGNMVAG